MQRKTGSCKCKGNRCPVCLNVYETETFTITVTHTSYKTNHSFDYNDKCLIYLLTCTSCLKWCVQVPQIVSDIVRKIINVMAENMRVVRLVFKSIFLNTLIMKGIMGSCMAFQLHWSIKQMQKILSNKNTTGDIPSKRCHLMVLMLKMISKLQFTCIYILLAPCTDLLLIINAILVIVIVTL